MCHAIPVSTNLIQSRLHISYGTIPAYIPSQRRPQWILIYKGQILPIRSQRSTQCTIAGFIQLIVYYIAPHIWASMVVLPILYIHIFLMNKFYNISDIAVHGFANFDEHIHAYSFPF